jgi:undecaprenyl phosphate N,N'-diacetylbacillosamine 1-phosphate transferase
MYQFFKRICDFFVALILIIALLPIFLIVIIVLTIQNDGKPFFVQKRGGYKNTVFKIYKFKTMNDKVDKGGNLLPDFQRLTKAGRFIRNSSLDELPQLINILIGDMSLVGPRPLVDTYLPLYNQIQKQRHDVKPGMTGWAQVNGRNALEWEKKFELDVWYVNSVSFLLDFKIIFQTVIKTIKKENINYSENITVEPFKGTHPNHEI